VSGFATFVKHHKAAFDVISFCCRCDEAKRENCALTLADERSGRLSGVDPTQNANDPLPLAWPQILRMSYGHHINSAVLLSKQTNEEVVKNSLRLYMYPNC
jgi:hypothetical protein